jgi:formylglycine-generating enzyme required for sulfatase activity
VPGLLRTTFRGIFTPTSRHNYRGFRCAQDGRE